MQGNQGSDEERSNINWYSDDDDDDEGKLTIKDDADDAKPEEEETQRDETKNREILPAPVIDPGKTEPVDVIQKLGDLSKINIPLEVSKLLSSISQTTINTPKEVSLKSACWKC